MPPPVFRRLVLISAVALIVGLAFVASDARYSSAQEVVLIDYDRDDDGLIEIATADQLRAVHFDMDGDGNPTAGQDRSGPYLGRRVLWGNGFTSSMPVAGCPPRDHDNDPATDDVASCIGYELIRDIDLTGGSVVIGHWHSENFDGYSAKFVGHGFTVRGLQNTNLQAQGLFAKIDPGGSVEGVGVISPSFWSSEGPPDGGIVGRLEGKLIGSYVNGGSVGYAVSGGIAGRVTTSDDSFGVVAHSYVVGTRVGGSSLNHGGLVGQMEHQRGPSGVNKSTCINSYFSGDVDSGQRGTVVGDNQNGQGRYINCVGDNTTDASDGGDSTTNTGAGAGTISASKAAMVAPVTYSGPFAGFDDYPIDGSFEPLAANEPRVDVWHFGDETNLPVLKAWGHDGTLALDRSLTGATTVNLCTRNLAVANEIIRHLKDNVRLSGVTTTPAAVTALSPCQSASDTQAVSITNLTNLVVTSASHPFNLRPDRTFPESPKLTTLDWDDFAYLTNATHFDLSGNALESLPPRLFQGIPLRWLDLSQNELTSLPADLFAGVAAVTATTGNSLQLAGNNLTDTGLPGRVFDPLTHLNGLDLSDNALTRINTRWFEKLVNLGRRGSEFTPGLGLHLAGNTITEHHYSYKVFTGVREKIVPYVDTTENSVTTAAADTLHGAIIAAMLAAGGSIGNLDIGLDSSSFYATTVTGSAATLKQTGYQPAAVTSCASAGTAGPDRYDYISGTTPDCIAQPHWSAPHKASDTASAAPGLSTSGNRGSIMAQWSHTSSAAFVAYQLRYRPSTADPWTPWRIAPITLASGTKSVTADAFESGVGYQVQLRVITTTGPPSTPIDGTATTTPANWLSGFTATTSTTAAGFIVLGWTAVMQSDLPSGHSVAEYYYRYKRTSASLYGEWHSAGTGTSHTIAGAELTPGVSYNVQLVGAIDGTDADAAPDYFTNRATATATSNTIPSTLTATGGTAPGTITLAWMRQTAFTHAQTRFQVRRKPRTTTSWKGVPWTDVPDSSGTGGDADTDAHNEVGYGLTGLLNGVEYDIEVRLHRDDTVGSLSAASTTGTATAVPTPASFSAATGTPGALNLTWTRQTAEQGAQANYELRYRYTGGTWTEWATISGSGHATNSYTLSGLLNNRSVEVGMRFHWSNAVGASPAVTSTATTGAVSSPAGLNATALQGSVRLNWTAQTLEQGAGAKYQLRYKKSSASWPTGGDMGWADIAGSAHGTAQHTVRDLESGVAYNFELRFHFSDAVGASAASTADATTTVIATPTGFSASATTTPGQVNLTWNMQTAVSGTGPHYEFRHRVVGSSWPEDGGWTDIPSSGPTTNSHSFSAQNGANTQVELRFYVNGPSAAASATVTPASIGAIDMLQSTTGYGSISLTWNAQSATTVTTAKYQVRYKKAADPWPTTGDLGWADVSGSDHSTAAATVVGLEGVSYTVQLRFFWSEAVGTSAPALAIGTPSAFPTLTNVRAVTGAAPGIVRVTWNEQTTVTAAGSKFQVRAKLSAAAETAWGAWTDVPDSNDADAFQYDETSHNMGCPQTRGRCDIELRFVVGTSGSTPVRVNNVLSGYLPRNFSAAPGTAPGSIHVTWDAHGLGCSGGDYIIRHRAFGGGWPSWSGGLGHATSHTFTGLTPGALYQVTITGNVCGAWYREQNQPVVQARASFAPTPTNFRAAAGALTAVTLTWDAQTAEQGSQAKYQLRYKKTSDDWPITSPFGWADISGSSHSTATATVSQLEPASYDFELRFHWSNSIGTSLAAKATATPMGIAAPANLGATSSATHGVVDLSWDQQTAHQTATTKFQVRYKASDVATWESWADVPDDSVDTDTGTNTHDEDAFRVTGLNPRRPYDFEVRLMVGTAPGTPALIRDIRAGYQPRGLTAATGSTPGTIDVSWDLQTANQAAQAQFATRLKFANQNWPPGGATGWVYFGDQSDPGSDQHDEVGYQHTGLVPGALYDIVVSFTADGTAFTHIPSLEVVQARAGVVPPPTGFTARASQSAATAIDLSWDAQSASTDASAQFEYRIKRTNVSWPTTSTQGWTAVADGGDMGNNKHDETGVTVSGLTAGAAYDVQLRFLWTTALGTSTEVRAMATASTVPTPPNFMASAGTVGGTVNLSWDVVNGATKYQYRYRTAGTNTWGTWTDVPDSGDANMHLYDETAYTVTGLTGGTSYNFEFKAVGSGGAESTAAMQTASAQTQAPPTSFTASTGTSPGQIALTWVAPTAGTITRFEYRYKRATTEAAYPATWQQVPDGSDSGNSQADEAAYTIGSLWAGVSYNVQLRVVATEGTSTPGAGTTATATAQVVAAPTSFTATRGTGPGEIDLSWAAITSGLPSTPGTPAVSDAVVRYEYRYKLNSATSYPTTGAGAWAQVPDQDDPADGQADETSYKITGLTAYAAYDVELRAAIHDNDEGTATTPEYHSASASDTNTRSGLAIPNDPQATGGTDPGQISINWVAQTTFGSTFTDAKYQIRYKLATASFPAASPFGWADISGSSRTTLATTLSGLMNRQLYDIELRFLPSSSLTSAAAKFQGTPTAVPTPTTFRAVTSTSAAGAVDLSWDAQIDSTDSSSQHQYRIKADGAAWPSTATMGWTDIGDSDDTDSHTYDEDGFTVTGLSAGTLYDVELRFFWTTAVGTSAAATATATASAIPAPPNFSATSGSVTDTVDLSWDAVSGITKYQYRSRLMGADWPATSPFGWADVPDSGTNGLADETSYTVTGLTGGSTYDFELRAHTAAATFGPTSSDSANAQPQSPPTSYTATTGTNPGEIDLGWTVPTGGTHTGFQYRHKRTGQADSAYIDWADVPDSGSDGRANETAYTITSLWAGVGYTVQIRAQSGSGASEPGASTTATATAKEVAAPTTLNATTGDGPGEIDITWTAITTGLPTGDAVVQYQYRTKLPSASWPTTAPLGWVNIPAASTTSHTITGLTAYTLYDIQLRAAIDDGTDTTGEPPKIANYHSEAVSATGARSGLARPANLRAAGGTNPGEIALTWDAQTTFGTGFTAAKYQYRTRIASPPPPATATWPSGGGWTDVPGSTRTTASYTIPNLMNGQLHDIEVRFVPSSSLMSAARDVEGTPTAVAVPSNFTASTSTDTAGAIRITWTAQSATSGSEAKYQYRRKAVSDSWPTSGDMGWTDIGDGSDADSNAYNENSLTFTRLNAGTWYHVQLRFHWSDAIGASAASATQTARASNVPIPGSFAASSGSAPGSINLTWAAVTDASYQYRYKLASATNYPATGTGSWASAGSGTSYTIMGLTNAASYDVQLRAVVSGSSSQPTPTRTAQAQSRHGPRNFAAAQGTNAGELDLTWLAPMQGSPTRYDYRYKRATQAGSAYSNWASAGTGTSFTVTSLWAGVSYDVQLIAVTAVGNSLPVTATQTARPVPPPTDFMASGGTNPGEVNLSWSAPTGVTILRYELRHRLGTTGAWSSWTSATASPYTYTGLLAGMSRTFEVRAVMQTVGASAAESTTGTPTPVPTPASFMATTGTFPGEVDLSWMAVTGATSYEYRYRLSSLSADPWPAAEGWTSVAATMTPSTTITLLNEGAAYQLEVRAAITNVGRSMAASASASARSASFTDSDARANPPAPAIPAAYDVAAAAIPGRIAIDLPGGTDPFIYRYRTANPGDWSRWFKVTPQAGARQFLIPGLTPGVEYDIEVRAYTAMTGFTLPLLKKKAQAAPLVKAEDFEASESSGVILLQWSSPALYTPDYYEYRTKPTGTQTWSDWVRVDHEGDRGSTQRKWVTGLESGISHDFELRMQTGAGPSPVANAAGSARLRIAEVHSIRPTVREVSVRAGDTIALTVDIYDGQEVLDNSIPGKPGSKLVFRWEDKLADGSTGSAGGTFATPNNGRRVTYTAPSSPGRYIVTAEAQPDGVCTSHHEGAAEITDAERAQCTATFTIRVSGIPAVPVPRPDPVDPTGAIPTSMTDDKGGTYTVFTPTKGGTFTGADITVTAPAGAIPDRTVVGIGAAVSDIPTPAPIPGATMSLAGSYYDINAIADTGEPPIPSYTLNEPATACLPFPQEFRADLSNVVVVQRKSTGDLSILSTKIRSNAGDLTVCGTLTQLPATVAVARLGLVPAPAPTTPSTPADTPDTGATTPGYAVLLLTLLTGALLITGIGRMRRMIKM